MSRSGLPVARYVATLLAAGVGFMALAVVEERDLFFPALGVEPAGAPAPAPAPGPESAAAEAAVRRFDEALEAAYRDGSTAPLEGLLVADELKARLADELAHPVARAAAAGLSLVELDVLKVEPRGGGGWEVTTDETWVAGPRRSRLRFRYVLDGEAGALRVAEMTPLLPEPIREPGR